MADDIENDINSEVNRGRKIFSQVRRGARQAFLGARRALPAVERSARLESPALSFLTGLVGAQPTPQEAQADMLAELGATPIGQTAPELAQQLQEMHATGSLLKEEVSSEDIAEVVAKWTGIPVSKMLQGDREKLLHLEEELRRRVAGQDEAISPGFEYTHPTCRTH